MARVLGERADPVWDKEAREMYVPMAPGGTHHLPFDPSVASTSHDFGGGPVPLLFLPSLDLIMSPALRRGDFDYAVAPTPLAHAGSGSMGIAPSMVAAATVGDGAEGAGLLAGNLNGGTLKRPFNVRTETARNNTGYFLTGSAGYLQALIYGFSGLRIRDQGLVEAYPPLLPASWSSLTLRNVEVDNSSGPKTSPKIPKSGKPIKTPITEISGCVSAMRLLMIILKKLSTLPMNSRP